MVIQYNWIDSGLQKTFFESFTTVELIFFIQKTIIFNKNQNSMSLAMLLGYFKQVLHCCSGCGAKRKAYY